MKAMKQITIATYNICHGHYAGFDWRAIAAAIQKTGADLVGFQEIDMFTNRTGGLDTVTELIRATGLPHALYVPAMDFDGGQYGTAILSRYPIRDCGIHPLPSAHYEPRAYGWVTVEDEDGAALTLLNTHLSYESHAQQDIQFHVLADWMKEHIPDGVPAVLTGDFNTEDFSAFSPLAEQGYSLVNDTPHAYKTFRTKPLAIDNIVYRASALTPVESGMVESAASDHNLLWCRFSLH